jgi:alpha-mannosidase
MNHLKNERMIEVGHLNVIIDAFKRSEDDKSYVLRIHEERGDYVTFQIKFAKELQI